MATSASELATFREYDAGKGLLQRVSDSLRLEEEAGFVGAFTVSAKAVQVLVIAR